ncbi:MAG TPA: glycosyltransferase [Burkholderiales bacterium]|nr:glycosyltransferase [Burkholderiales bacterium]
MVAFHFPPFAGSSGVQRALRFVQYLPAFQWQPIVLTVHPRAYECTADDLVGEIPHDTPVERAFAVDAARHLSIRRRYLRITATPDRWTMWRFGAIRSGLRLIEKWRPDVIWSTYPIATAHTIAARLHRRTGLPWIAEFRDPMAQSDYPTDPVIWKSFKRIEEDALSSSRFAVFATAAAAEMYTARYPDAADRVRVIENGFDQAAFEAVDASPLRHTPLTSGATTLLHSGVVYPSERDPSHLFEAVANLRRQGAIDPAHLRLRFRGSGHDAFVRSLAARAGVIEFVELLPSTAYGQALEEMVRADGLLLLQAANCDNQIPAKLYEYVRAQRPVLALTSHEGSTGRFLRGAGVDSISPLDSVEAIARLLVRFVEDVRAGRAVTPAQSSIEGRSRRAGAGKLAELLTEASR